MDQTGNSLKELKALISMLDEPNEDLFNHISSHIIRFGDEALPFLEDISANFMNPFAAARAKTILREIENNKIRQSLKIWKSSKHKDINEARIIIENHFFPEYNYNDSIRKTELLVKQIWLELNENMGPLDKVRTACRIFINQQAFRFFGELDNSFNKDLPNKFPDSQDIYFVSLWLYFLSVSQKLKFPVYGALKGNHYMGLWINEKGDDHISFLDEKKILIVVFTSLACVIYDEAKALSYIAVKDKSEEHKTIEPVDNMQVVIIYLQELGKAFRKSGKTDFEKDITELIDTLEQD